MSDGTPRVSVIIPVRDRREMLRGALEGLAKQTQRDFEVVVIDDGSSDSPGDEVSAVPGLRAQLVRTEGVGAVAARRAGVEAARGEIFAFTDSDCIPDTDWLAEGVAAIDDGADLVQGATYPVRPVGLLERSVGVEYEDGLYATCNVLYRRTAFERAGGFDLKADRRLGFRSGEMARGLGFGEDTLLGWRVRRAGRAVFVPQAIVRHEVVSPPLREMMRRAWISGAFPGLVREVPELRETLLQSRLLLGRRRLPLYGLIVSLLARRGWLAALFGGWWVGARALDVVRIGGARRKAAAALPVELGIDVVTAAGLVVGSARAREAVL
jgi:glycosyltransferase involved in cell wall biosynthesis